jgi:hypothetical protein
VKAADIPDEAFLAAVKQADDIRRRRRQGFASRWDIAAILAGHPEHVGTAESCQDFPAVPAKVVLAKARKLIRRHLLNGCACGCRGDFTIRTGSPT